MVGLFVFYDPEGTVGKRAWWCFLFYFLFAAAAVDAADDLVKGLRRDVQESKNVIAEASARLQAGSIPNVEIARLKIAAENIRATHLLMVERFRSSGDKVAALGGKAVERQNSVVEGYHKILEEYLALIDSLTPDGTASAATLDRLKTLLETIVPKRKQPLLGTLPYKHLGNPAREPATSPLVVPAYKGGDRTVTSADTVATPEAPLSKEIVELARFLQWNPVLIYEWVKNNVETEWYFGVMKGVEETLRQKSGNDADQAALLVSLMRASGFPSRFVKGTIEFFPGIDKVKNLTGIDDPLKIAAFFQKAGIPFKPVIAGGKIANFQVEHIWVESQIPYSNYRGAVIDDMGKSWLGLDTSIKPPGLAWNAPLEITGFPLDSLRDDYLQAVQTVTPLEFVKARAEEYLAQNNPGKSWHDLLQTKTIIPDILNIIPASLQFKQIAITGEYSELPAVLKQQVRFTAKDGSNELFSITQETQKLSNKRLALTYEPESVEDQQTIDSYGGLDNTPAYLVRLRPVITLDGERLVVASDGLSMGADFTLEIDIDTPSGSEKIVSSQINGNLAVIGIVGGSALPPGLISNEDDAQTILYKEAIGYIDRWNKGEEELAALLGQRLSRPTVTVVTVGNQVEITMLLDIPFDMKWQGVYLDAAYRRVAIVGNSNSQNQFMQLSALQGSVLEHRIFEDDLKAASISTAKLLQLAKTDNVPIFSIDKTNIDTILPQLPFGDTVKNDIANAVNQNLIVMVPQSETAYRDWRGAGYRKENRDTGESGWMLSGQIAGGMTAVNRGKWSRQDLVAILTTPSKVSSDLWSTGPLQLRSLGDNGNIALMQAVGSFDADNPDRTITEATRQAVAREYFKTHSDVDFLVILSTFDYHLPEADAQGFYLEAKNDIQGIGRELFDYSSLFGSAGRLQGTIDLGNITPRAAALSGETLEETITTLTHELSHRFGAYVKLKNPDGTLNTTLLGKDNAHWSYLLGTKGSLLYGNGWQANPDGTFTSTAARSAYSQLDLYLMGMIPPEQVPPMLLIDNPSINRTKLPHQGDTISGTPKTVTINDIIAAEGPRIPTAADAPKTFTIGYVLLRRPGDNTTKAAQAAELLRKGFAGRFTELTQSKGSVSGITPEVALLIESPAEGAVINGPDVTVSGTVVNTTGGTETGVTVNGVPATVSGTRFIVNHVPLMDGVNTVTVTATDANGLTATATRTVTAQAGHYIRINSNIESGTAPLEFSLWLDGTMPLDDAGVWHPDTPAVIQLPTDNPEEYRYRITAEGTYEFTAEVTNEEGQVYRDTVTITVVALGYMDMLLKNKWSGMKAAMSSSDINKALSFVSESAKNKYQAVFQALSESLPEIAAGMRPIEYDYVKQDVAEYRISRTETITDQPLEINYYIYFSRGKDGLWKIEVM